MKNVILAATLAAIASAAAAPGFAMDNPVNESRAKIERILAKQNGVMAQPAAPKFRTLTLSMKEPVHLDRYEAAKQRLFGDRSGPSGR